MIELDADWADPELWAAMRAASAAAHARTSTSPPLDRKLDADGGIVRVRPEQRIYLPLFWRTMLLSAVIAALCLLARLPDRAPARDPAAALLQPPDDPGAAAVLDLAPRAHHQLDGRCCRSRAS